MEKPDYEKIDEELMEFSSNLLDNHQIGNSKIILATAAQIKVLAWSTEKQEEQSKNVIALTKEVVDLKDNLKNYSAEAKKSSRWMMIITIVMGILAAMQLFLLTDSID